MSYQEIEKSEVMRNFLNSSPYYKLLGMEIVRVDKEYAQLQMPVTYELTFGTGIVHGGAISSLADSACAVALFPLLSEGETVTTTNITINYISSISSGKIIATSNVIHKGKSTGISEVKLENQDGKLIAKAIATHLVMKV